MSSAQLQLYQVYVWSVTQVLNRGRSAFLAADRDTRERERERREKKEVKCTKRRHLSLCFGSERCACMHLDID